jgi:acyl-coenzyme A synthetase/AMP-(fatty) acid ligase
MIPNAFVQMEKLPMTPNGKMNRMRMEAIYKEQKTTGQREEKYGI